MDTAMILEYGWVLLVLIGLEGILAADNAVVMAVMVKHLPDKQQKKALFYGLMGAFVFRFGALFLISFWQMFGKFKRLVPHIYYISLLVTFGNMQKEKTEKKRRRKKLALVFG